MSTMSTIGTIEHDTNIVHRTGTCPRWVNGGGASVTEDEYRADPDLCKCVCFFEDEEEIRS